MTPWDLQKSLIAEIEELLAQMQLKNAAGEDVFGVKGYAHRRTMSHGSSEPRYYSEFATTTKKRTDTEPSWR